jgi:hypothetical protein
VNLRVGAGYTIDHVFSTPQRPVDKLLLAADLTLPIVPIDAATHFAIGTEYSRWFASNQYGAFRIGYRLPTDLGPLAGMTVGLGYGMEFPGTVVSLDYAFVPYGELGVSHRISLTGNFGLKKTQSPIYDEGQVFAPPTNVQVVGGDKRVQLTWSAPKAEVTGYNIYMAYNPYKGPWYKLNQRGLVKGTSISSGGLYNNYPYYFALTSVKQGDPKDPKAKSKESEKSTIMRVVPGPAGNIGTPVTMPTTPAAGAVRPAASAAPAYRYVPPAQTQVKPKASAPMAPPPLP